MCIEMGRKIISYQYNFSPHFHQMQYFGILFLIFFSSLSSCLMFFSFILLFLKGNENIQEFSGLWILSLSNWEISIYDFELQH